MLKRLLEHLAVKKLARIQAREEAHQRYLYELLSPDFDLVQRVHGKPISKSLRALYEDKDELKKSCISKVIPDQRCDRWIFVESYLDSATLASVSACKVFRSSSLCQINELRLPDDLKETILRVFSSHKRLTEDRQG